MDTRAALEALAKVSGSAAEPLDRRLESATEAFWVSDQHLNTEPSRILVKAVFSRLVDDLKDHPGAVERFGGFGFWREFHLNPALLKTTPPQVSLGQSLTAGQLMFEAARHEEAIPFFEGAIASHLGREKGAAILASYNYEVVGRKLHNVDYVNRAIEIIERNVSSIDPAEHEHIMGHLLLLKGRFSEQKSLGLERLGVWRLQKAAQMNPSYCGCYVSSFAEYGNFLGTIEACVEAFRTRPFDRLSARDSQLVQLEILFYAAYSLMAVGELERARVCFEKFSSVCQDLELQEARDHARLFLVKIGLKRKSITNLTAAEFRRAYGELRELSFRAALSVPVSEETERYEQVVSFLRQLSGDRERGALEWPRLEVLSERAFRVLEILIGNRPDLLNDMRITVGPRSEFEADCEALAALLRHRLNAIPGPSVEVVQKASAPIAATRVGPAFVMWRYENGAAWQATGAEANIIPFSTEVGDASEIPDIAAASALATIWLSIVAIKRFWTEDQYVFGLVPCLESPATNFQRPEISVALAF